MNALGGRVVVYEVDAKHTVTRTYQTVFLMPHAKRVSERPIPTLSLA